MANIIFNVAEFECVAPVLGQTYRQGASYIFNWETEGTLYESYGLNVTIKLFYLPEGAPPEIEYVAVPIPYIANSFLVDQLPGSDITSFRLEFSVDDGAICYYSIDIPYSSIILI